MCPSCRDELTIKKVREAAASLREGRGWRVE
jgi:hypothetical protein